MEEERFVSDRQRDSQTETLLETGTVEDGQAGEDPRKTDFQSERAGEGDADKLNSTAMKDSKPSSDESLAPVQQTEKLGHVNPADGNDDGNPGELTSSPDHELQASFMINKQFSAEAMMSAMVQTVIAAAMEEVRISQDQETIESGYMEGQDSSRKTETLGSARGLSLDTQTSANSQAHLDVLDSKKIQASEFESPGISSDPQPHCDKTQLKAFMVSPQYHQGVSLDTEKPTIFLADSPPPRSMSGAIKTQNILPETPVVTSILRQVLLPPETTMMSVAESPMLTLPQVDVPENPATIVNLALDVPDVEMKEVAESEGSISETEISPRSVSKAIAEYMEGIDREVISISFTDIPLSIRAESAKGMSQMNEIVNELERALCIQGIVVLTSAPGEGKTTAAHILIHLYFGTSSREVTYFQCPEDINLDVIPDNEEGWLVIIDNFLGLSCLDSYDRWKKTIKSLTYLTSKRSKDLRFLLLVRKDILDEAFEAYGLELIQLIGSHNTVALDLDQGKLLDDCCPKLINAKAKKILSKRKFPIGFALLCKIYEEALKLDKFDPNLYFEKPLTVFHQILQAKVQDPSLKLAFTLLAVANRPLTRNDFLTPQAVNSNKDFNSIEIMEKFAARQLKEEIKEDIMQHLEAEENLTLKIGGFVCFRSDIFKTIMLQILCQENPEILAEVIDMREFCYRVRISAQPVKESDRYVLISESTAVLFVDRVLKEMKMRNFRHTLASPLFKSTTFRKELWEHAEGKVCMNALSHKTDSEALHFAYWAATSSDFLEECCEKLSGFTQWEICQALIACALLNRRDDYIDLNNTLDVEAQREIASSQMGEIIDGTLDIAHPRETNKPNWSKIPFHDDETILSLAAWRGNRDVVITILNESPSAPLNAAGFCCRTVLMHFCARGDGDMVQNHLLDKSDLTMADGIGDSTLHIACMAEGGVMPLRLLRASDVHANNRYGVTSLMIACERDSGTLPKKWYQHLISKGARTTDQDMYGRTCLHMACASKNKKMIESLAKSTGGVSKDTLYDFTPLDYVLLKKDNLDLVNMFLGRFGAQIITGQSLLIPLRFNNMPLLEKLLSLRNVKYNIPEALDQAAISGNLAMVKLLLKKAPKVSKNEMGIPPNCGLHAACIGGSVEVTELILARGADVNSRDSYWITPLMYAFQKGKLDLAKFLISKGADIHATDATRKTCFHHAVISDSPEILDWYSENYKYNIEAEDNDGSTPLLHAVQKVRRRSSLWLLSKGADPTKTDISGLNCLHRAAGNGDLFLVKLFEPLGKDTIDFQGRTALDWAKNGIHTDCVAYLQGC